MKVGIIFPGYGSQYVGMGKELYDEHRIIQEYFEEAYNCSNINFIKLCFASSDQELSKISNAYPSIFLTSVSLFELLKQIDIKPDVVTGYGIGHYAAFFAAQGINFPDGLYLIKKLAAFYEEALPDIDLSVIKVEGTEKKQLIKLCKKFDNNITISAYNFDMQYIVSGKNIFINEFKQDLLKQDLLKKIRISDLNPAFGLHTNLMHNVIEQFKTYLEKVDFKDLTIPFISNIDAKEIVTGKKVKNYLTDNLDSPIKWDAVMDKLADLDLIIEAGPGKVLSEVVKLKYPEKKVLSFNTKADFEEIKKSYFEIKEDKGK